MNVPPLDLSLLLGTWHNTDRGDSGGILRLEVREQNGALRVRGVGVGTPEPIDWGEIDAATYAINDTSRAAWGFTATYEFEHLQAKISGYVNLKLGCGVCTTYNTFRDPRGRANYYTREFFHVERKP